MKKLMLMSLLVIAQVSFAQRAKEVKRLSYEQAREAVEKSSSLKFIEDAKSKGKDLKNDAVYKAKVTQLVELALKDVVTLEAGSSSKIAKLVDVAPKETLTAFARLNSIIKDKTSNANEKAAAKKSLELITKSAHTVEQLTATGKANTAQIEKVIKVSEKIAHLNLGEKSKSFVEKYEKALAEGKSIEDAVKIGFGGKHSLKDLLECV